MRSWVLLLVLLLSSVARADEESDAALKKQLEQALQQDAAGKAKDVPAPVVPQSSTPRGSQSLNPDISAILDANGGYERRAPSYRNGDDPDLHGTASRPGAGFTAQEVEIAASALVDPYFKGEVYLTIPNLSGLEVEEAFATTTSLPGNLQIKFGSFRGAFGRENGQHLHVQDFTRRPLVNAAFLGVDGMRGPGGQVSWLSPLPFYLVLYAEAFSLGAPDDLTGPLATFGGGSATDLTYATEAKYFFPVAESVSVYGGFSAATGVSPGTATALGIASGANRRSELYGADLYVKWKPLNVAGGYTAVSWQSEAIFRHLEDGGGLGAEWDGGAYTQLVLQFARNWFAGARFDFIGLPQSTNTGRTLRGALDLTWQASEFARVRAYVEAENASVASLDNSLAAYLQLEFSIGAHGAHPF